MKTKSIFKLLFGLSVVAVLFVTACSPGSDDSSSPQYISLGVVKGNVGSFSIELDNKVILYPQSGITSPILKDGKRVILQYSLDSKVVENGKTNYKATLYYLDSILTKKPALLTRANNDSIGKDPINVRTIWNGGKYLNVDFQIKVGNTSQKRHLISLAVDTIQKSADTVSFIFKHNANQDDAFNSKTGLVSFDMSNYLQAGKKLNLKFKYKNYSGENKVYSLKLNTDSIVEEDLKVYNRINAR